MNVNTPSRARMLTGGIIPVSIRPARYLREEKLKNRGAQKYIFSSQAMAKAAEMSTMP